MGSKGTSGIVEFQYAEVVAIIRTKTVAMQLDELVQIATTKLSTDLTKDQHAKLKRTLVRIRSEYKGLLMKRNRNFDRIAKEDSKWLNRTFQIGPKAEAKTRGRPKKTGAVSARTVKRRFEENVDQLTDQLLHVSFSEVFDATANVAAAKRSSIVAILERLRTPRRAASLITKVKDQLTPYTPEEACSLIMRLNLSKSQFQQLRKEGFARGANLYPTYYAVQECRKKFRPIENLTVTETKVSLPLQDLLYHTASRLISMQEDDLDLLFTAMERTYLSCCLEYSWGFDGSSGHSEYKQRFANSNVSDATLVATTIIPLRIKTEDDECLWINETPQSPFGCRPLKLEFCKETNEFILDEKRRVEAEAAGMDHLSLVTKRGNTLRVGFKGYLTIIDGKVYNIINGLTSFQNCPICGSTPKQMNTRPSKISSESTDDSGLRNGISPLHSWIRCMEFLLHLSYRNIPGLRCWKVKQILRNKLEERKRTIQSELQLKLGINVDKPKWGGSGTTNDGNTARRFFHPMNRAEVSRILDVDETIIEDLHVVLCAISSNEDVHADRFGTFSESLASRIVQLYPWYYLPVSVHKLLFHGRDIIKHSALPLGYLSEQAGESRNKDYRNFRRYHAFQGNRERNIVDVFNRCLDSSDPKMVAMRQQSQPEPYGKHLYPDKVFSLLDSSQAYLFSQEGGEGIEFSADFDFDLENETQD